VLVFSGNAVFDDLAPCAVLVELGSAFLEGASAPETGESLVLPMIFDCSRAW
jgi:hypothetical protein